MIFIRNGKYFLKKKKKTLTRRPGGPGGPIGPSNPGSPGVPCVNRNTQLYPRERGLSLEMVGKQIRF